MILILIEIKIDTKLYNQMFGPNWKIKLGQIHKSKHKNHISGIGLKICREIFSNITGFRFSYTTHFRNPKLKIPHRIIVKSNIVNDRPSIDYKFSCNRDEFLFKPKDNDWLLFMCISSDFKTAWILGKYYLCEFMPDLLKSDGRTYFFETRFMIPPEINMDQIQYKKGLKTSHNVLHDIQICQL